MRKVLLVSAAALALAACTKPAGEKPAGAPAGVSSAGEAVTLPTRKAGLWEQTMLRDGKPPMGPGAGKVRMCLDAATDAKMNVFGRQMTRGLCPASTVARGPGGTFVFTNSCNVGEAGKFTSKGVASGDFSSSYTVHTETDWQGAPVARINGHHTMDTAAAWMGPCPADMKPGDVVMGNGFKINMAAIAAGPSAPPAGGEAAPDSGQ